MSVDYFDGFRIIETDFVRGDPNDGSLKMRSSRHEVTTIFTMKGNIGLLHVSFIHLSKLPEAGEACNEGTRHIPQR